MLFQAPIVETVEATSTISSLIDQYADKYGVTNKSLLAKIAHCESTSSQFDQDGEVKRGIVNSLDVGIFQINEKYHLDTSKKLGLDIYIPEGNVEYAVWLYSQEGSVPWNWSKSCWSE